MDIKGRWLGTSEAIVRGDAAHHAAPRGKDQRLDNVQFTYDITGQDGHRFWGTIASRSGESPIRESLIGVIGYDGKTIVARDSDGLYQGTIIDDDTIDVIYSHTGKKSAVVAVHRFKRQK